MLTIRTLNLVQELGARFLQQVLSVLLLWNSGPWRHVDMLASKSGNPEIKLYLKGSMPQYRARSRNPWRRQCC
ncbi:hypothetical protein SLE2022_353550 [Rubroshorea leprosula]